MNQFSKLVRIEHSRFRYFMTRISISFLLALGFSFASIPPAHAMTAVEAIEKVCNATNGLCGPDFSSLSAHCFHAGKGDEVSCAIAIISAITGVGQVGSAIDSIVTCAKDVKNLNAIQGQCKQALDALGLPADKYNEAIVIVKRCAAIKDVDDTIMCADYLLNSSFAADAGVRVPEWVYLLFDIYGDIKATDYWSLVYHVGATVACIAAQYFSGLDVCSFLKDLAAIGVAIYDAAGAVIDFLSDNFTTESRNMPPGDYFAQHWAPKIEMYAQNMFQYRTNGYWGGAHTGAEGMRDNCYDYFHDHTVGSANANSVCDAMLSGSGGSGGAFIQKGFSQMVARRGAQYLLPNLVRAAVKVKYSELNAKGIKVAWNDVYAIYGYSINGMVNPDTYIANFKYYQPDSWPKGSVAALAHDMLTAATDLPAYRPLSVQDGETLAKRKLAEAESKVDIQAQALIKIKNAQVKADGTAEGNKQRVERFAAWAAEPLNELIAGCKHKKDPKTVCEAGVKALYEDCGAQFMAFADAHPLVNDFDNPASKPLERQRTADHDKCIASIRGYIKSLPDYKNADIRDKISDHLSVAAPTGSNLPPANKVTPKPSTSLPQGTAVTGNATTTHSPTSLGGAAGASSGNGFNAQNSVGKTPPAGLTSLAPPLLSSSPKSDEADPALKHCKPYEKRKDEAICSNASGFRACQALVNSGKAKSCRLKGSAEIYMKPAR